MPCCIAAASRARGRVVDLDPEAVGVLNEALAHAIRPLGHLVRRAAGHGPEGRRPPPQAARPCRRNPPPTAPDGCRCRARRLGAVLPPTRCRLTPGAEREPADRPVAHRVLDLRRDRGSRCRSARSRPGREHGWPGGRGGRDGACGRPSLGAIAEAIAPRRERQWRKRAPRCLSGLATYPESCDTIIICIGVTMPADKRDVLRTLNFGNQIAEEERDFLKSYFVETQAWQRIYGGEVDIVYGPKGAGKSAIYVLISDSVDALFDRKILIITGENPRGTPAFKDLVADPPTSENEFVTIWKLYFSSIIARTLAELEIRNMDSDQLYQVLSDNKLLPPKDSSLGSILKSVRNYILRIVKPESVRGPSLSTQ